MSSAVENRFMVNYEVSYDRLTDNQDAWSNSETMSLPFTENWQKEAASLTSCALIDLPAPLIDQMLAENAPKNLGKVFSKVHTSFDGGGNPKNPLKLDLPPIDLTESKVTLELKAKEDDRCCLVTAISLIAASIIGVVGLKLAFHSTIGTLPLMGIAMLGGISVAFIAARVMGWSGCRC